MAHFGGSGPLLTSAPLKNRVIQSFSFIQNAWNLSAPPQENSNSVQERMYWLRIKHILREIIRQLRLLQSTRERQIIHLSHQYESVEIVYEKLIDLWTNFINVETLHIPNDHIRWDKLLSLNFDLLMIFFYQRNNISFYGN